MNKLVLIRGIPGSGKSTLARDVTLKEFNCLHYEADMYHMVKGVYVFNRENIHKAHRWCFESTKIGLNNGFSVVVSNTFTKISEMSEYISLAKEMEIPYYVFKCVGNYQSVHNVPLEVMDAMRNRWQDYPEEIEHEKTDRV